MLNDGCAVRYAKCGVRNDKTWGYSLPHVCTLHIIAVRTLKNVIGLQLYIINDISHSPGATKYSTYILTLQIILDLCIPEKELAKTRSQISVI